MVSRKSCFVSIATQCLFSALWTRNWIVLLPFKVLSHATINKTTYIRKKIQHINEYNTHTGQWMNIPSYNEDRRYGGTTNTLAYDHIHHKERSKLCNAKNRHHLLRCPSPFQVCWMAINGGSISLYNRTPLIILYLYNLRYRLIELL